MSDSAGIEIVVNTQPDRVLTLAPLLRVGVVDGNPDLQFDKIRTVAIDDAGGFWVVDRNPSIRHYDATGRFVGSVGAEGQGPGEARSYANAWTAGNEVLAWGNPPILQRFAVDGTFIDSRSAYAPGGALILPLGYSAGKWILQFVEYSGEGTREFRQRTVIVTTSQMTGTEDTVGVFPRQLTIRGGIHGFTRASWFFGNPSFAVATDGRVFVSDAAEYRVAIYNLDGSLTRVVRRSQPPRAIDPAWRADIEESIESAVRGDYNAPVHPQAVSQMTEDVLPPNLPAHLPFIENILVGADGAMWIERADRHPRPGIRAVAHALGWIRHAWRPEWVAPRVYDVFAASGEYRGTVDVPGYVEPMAVTADRVYGVLYDSMGVEFVVAYQLVETGGTRKPE